MHPAPAIDQEGKQIEPQPNVNRVGMGEEIDINRNRQKPLLPKWGKADKLKLENAPDAREIAAYSGLHETGEKRHSAKVQEAVFGINP